MEFAIVATYWIGLGFCGFGFCAGIIMLANIASQEGAK